MIKHCYHQDAVHQDIFEEWPFQSFSRRPPGFNDPCKGVAKVPSNIKKCPHLMRFAALERAMILLDTQALIVA